jgi:APA family basic amino acid/polyamine antiporter
VFFAFYGFDTISTAAEEAKNPGRDLTIGIVGSMLLCTVIYMLVAAAAVGALPFGVFASSAEPLALILRELGRPGVAQWVAAAVVVGVPTVILAFLYGPDAHLLRDGPRRPAAAKAQPAQRAWRAGRGDALHGGDRGGAGRRAQARRDRRARQRRHPGGRSRPSGVCLIVLRLREPERVRVFRAPLWPVVGAVTVVGCVYLFASLPARTQVYFLLWNGLGLAVYLLYARRSSALATV